MYTYTCKRCKGIGKVTGTVRTQQAWAMGDRDCWNCNGKCVIELPKAIVEYRKRVKQLSDELKVEHHVDGHNPEETYEHRDTRYNSLLVNEYYDEEPIKDAPTE